MNEQKPPQTTEQSLKYIAWSLKDIALQLTEINKSVQDFSNYSKEWGLK